MDRNSNHPFKQAHQQEGNLCQQCGAHMEITKTTEERSQILKCQYCGFKKDIPSGLVNKTSENKTYTDANGNIVKYTKSSSSWQTNSPVFSSINKTNYDSNDQTIYSSSSFAHSELPDDVKTIFESLIQGNTVSGDNNFNTNSFSEDQLSGLFEKSNLDIPENLLKNINKMNFNDLTNNQNNFQRSSSNQHFVSNFTSSELETSSQKSGYGLWIIIGILLLIIVFLSFSFL